MESKPKYLERKNSSTTNTLEFMQDQETKSSNRINENNTISSKRIVEEVKELVDEEIKETPKNNKKANDFSKKDSIGSYAKIIPKKPNGTVKV